MPDRLLSPWPDGRLEVAVAPGDCAAPPRARHESAWHRREEAARNRRFQRRSGGHADLGRFGPADRRGAAHRAAGAGGGRAAHHPGERGPARPRAARDRGASPAARHPWRRARALRGLRDQPPRDRGPRHAHPRGQVHPDLRPPGGRHVLRPGARPQGEGEPHRRGRRARAPAQGGAGSGHGREPVPEHRARGGPGAVRPQAPHRGLGAGRGDRGPGRRRATTSRATAASVPARRARSRSPCGRKARRSGSKGPATAGR